MLHFRPRHADFGLLPVLYEALIAEPLWGIVYRFDHPEGGLPQCDYVETTVLNEDNEERTVVPLWTRPEYAKQCRLGWDTPFRDRMLCVEYFYGGDILKRLAQRNADIVIDHGHAGLILRTDCWRPAVALHGQTSAIELLPTDTASVDGWIAADPEDFPVWRDRLTSLLRNVELARNACLLWLPKTPHALRRLCLVTVSAIPAGDVDARIYNALPLIAQDLALPPLAYLPLYIGHRLWHALPAPPFFCDHLEHALNIASGKPSSQLHRL